MASLQGLPPLPKSLSGLLNFSSAQWKELERLHAMRTMIQQDLNRGQHPGSPMHNGEGSESPSGRKKQKFSLDAQLALLRKEMVGLRQLDMSLLCQLWSLNESIQEYKQLMQDRIHSHSSSSGWDNGFDQSSCDESEPNYIHYTRRRRSRSRSKGPRDLNAVPETLSLSSSSTSSSQSSLEFGDI